jgi:GntR family transcriptional regulator
MEFYIDKHSPTPVSAQIQEQIKLAVMMGVFRKGDTLPSIRDIEKQTGVNRSQIHKAYLEMRKAGLLVLTRGKGSIVATATEAPRSIDGNCRKLSKTIVSRVRRMGLSPTAFARYLSRYAQETERNLPLILYVDIHEEIASQMAEEVSRLWQVPVAGMALRNLKPAAGKGAPRHKILVNHIMYDSVTSILPRKKSDIISVEWSSTEQTEKVMQGVKPNSSVLVIHHAQPHHNLQFILARIRKQWESQGITIASASVRSMSGFRKLLNKSQYDYYLVGPRARGDVPRDLRQDPRVLQLVPQLDPASLEIARIRAGVII